MLFYNKVGELTLGERILDNISWRGDDAPSRRGLWTWPSDRRRRPPLLGQGCGVDVWLSSAITGDRSYSVFAECPDRTSRRSGGSQKESDVRNLAFTDTTSEVIVSNFVVPRLPFPPHLLQRDGALQRPFCRLHPNSAPGPPTAEIPFQYPSCGR